MDIHELAKSTTIQKLKRRAKKISFGKINRHYDLFLYKVARWKKGRSAEKKLPGPKVKRLTT